MASIYLSPALVASLATDAGAYRPVILWENLVTVANIEADHEDPDFPITNTANPATNLRWASDDTGDQDITITPSGTDAIDAIGIARHNFGTAGISVTVTADTGSGHAEVFPELLPGNDDVLLFLFEEVTPIEVIIHLEVGATAPEAAVIFAGKALRMEWGVRPGHTPLPYGRERDIVAGRSQSGEYLGRIQSGGMRKSRADFGNLSAGFYRVEMDPFIAYGGPFFFAWAPDPDGGYPLEVGYCWFTNDPVPVPSLPGYIDITLDLEGIGLPVAENS